MPIPFRLDWVIDRSTNERAEQASVELDALGEYGVDQDEARVDWQAILEHKWYLGERLGRDVGMRVAMLDYFENIKSAREHAALARKTRSRVKIASLASAPILAIERVFGDFFETLRGFRPTIF